MRHFSGENWTGEKCWWMSEGTPHVCILTVSVSSVVAKCSHIFRQKVWLQHTHIHRGAPFHCEETTESINTADHTDTHKHHRLSTNTLMIKVLLKVRFVETGVRLASLTTTNMHRILTWAGKEVPAAQQIFSVGAEEVFGAAQTSKTEIPGGRKQTKLSIFNLHHFHVHNFLRFFFNHTKTLSYTIHRLLNPKKKKKSQQFITRQIFHQ